MTFAGYAWERFCFLSFAPLLVWTAATNLPYFGHLTYWTLALHAVYFSVDKSSPHAKPAIYLLHGASFSGAMAIFMAYAAICVGGKYKFGTWLEWEMAVGKRAGTTKWGDSFEIVVFQKSFEHIWPVIALLVDAMLSKDTLTAAIGGLPKFRTTALAVASFLAFGTLWEQTQKTVGKGSPLDVYLQPQELFASHILGRFGITPPDGLPEDIFFTNLQKICMVSFAFYFYWKFVAPYCGAAAKKAAGKKKA